MNINELTRYPNEVDTQFIILMVEAMDHNLAHGDLLHRISRFDAYVLENVSINELSLGEFVADPENDNYVKHLAARIKKESNYPPIVYDSITDSIIDGNHRANAVALLGHKTVRAYVGLEELADPNWDEANLAGL